MADQSIYTVGGTVQAGGGVYIPRKADDELLQHCRASEFAFILSSRQVGKSSLMVRTAQQLEQEGIRSVIIDLSSIGVKLSADEWYLGILDEIANTLKLKTDIFAWWSERSGLGSAQRLNNFFRDVLLKEVSDPVVLFFDEIDSTLSIPFSDDFFATLRAIHNARSTVTDFKRLSFVMIGVATPSDLIADSKRTPFNIGYRVELTDFTLEEALPLAGELGVQTLDWVFAWTGGHPYLTQILCAHLSKNKTEHTEESVADVVKSQFEGEQGRHDNNLQFVRDMLTKRAPDIQRVLKTYKDIRSGKKVTDDERSIPKTHLKISGVVRRENGNLLPRNLIYERAFDLTWIKENTPPTTARRLVFVSTFVTIIALIIAGYFAWLDYNRTPAERAAQFTSDFQSAQSPEVRLKNLAGLFKMNDDTYTRSARQLFTGLSQEDRLALFAQNTSWGASDNQGIVIKGIYSYLGNTEAENKLLEAMRNSIKQDDPPLAREITAWLEGREELNQMRYSMAVSNLNIAIGENNENFALYYDRAQAYIELGKDYFPDALDDLARIIQLDKNRSSDTYRLIQSNQQLDRYWTDHKEEEKYSELAKAITIPMVFIPEGEFMMGFTLEQADMFIADCEKQYGRICGPMEWFTSAKPLHKVYLDAYYIDQYEVTNARYAECVAAGVCSPPRDSDSGTPNVYYGRIEFDNYPVTNVTWFDASTFCQWRGARLPTEAEWEKAANWNELTHEKYVYPSGNEFDGSRLNFCDKNCKLSHADTNSDDGFAETSPVGTYPNGVSPYGVYDMVGNVMEWVNDWYQVDYYVTLGDIAFNPQGPLNGGQRVMRGGNWFTVKALTTSIHRVFYDPETFSEVSGFRCARSE